LLKGAFFMTLVPLTTCCLALGVDPKTLRLWLAAAQLSCCPHPSDARLKCLTASQLQQLAQLHARPLLSAEAARTGPPAPADLFESSPEASAASAGPDETALSLQLASLQQQVITLQAQVTELALSLLALRCPHDFAPPAASEDQSLSSALPATEAVPVPVTSPFPKSHASEPERPRRRSRALPLIEVRPDGSVVVIAPKEGVLPLQPDSAEWFAWLASIEAFSFECPTGHYSATRKMRSGQRVQAWNLHCSLHGRSCGLYVGQTPALTLARLLKMVTIIRTRLAVS
jgi:hypothetical protein